MAELERIYKDTDTGGWGWVTQESTGGGDSQPALYARLSIRGGADSGADVTVPLVGSFFIDDTTHQIDATTATGPSTFEPGHTTSTWVTAPWEIPAGGVLVLNYAEFMVSNGEGTEKLRIEYDGSPIVLPDGASFGQPTRFYLPFADCSVTEQIGSDLTLVSFDPGTGVPGAGSAGISTTAGGQFFQETLLTLGYAPPA